MYGMTTTGGADDSRGSALGRMAGHGFYTEHSEAQRSFGELGLDWLREASAEVEPPNEPTPFVIADFGAAGGGNSLAPMRAALEARRGSGPAVVVHTDIASNDFSALFELVDSAPDSYLGAPGVFALAAGRSFYHRLLPDNFLSVGWSSIAVHWLSKLPAPIDGHIYCSFAQGHALDALRRQSVLDWRGFLDHRAHELRRSGRLVVLGGAARPDGASGAEGLMGLANAGLQALVGVGTLRPSEYATMTIPTWNRTEAEFLDPFTSGDFDGRLQCRRHVLHSLPDPYFETYSADGDLDRYVDSVAGFFTAAFEQSLWAQLGADRSDGERVDIATQFRAELRSRIADYPPQAACQWQVAMLDIAAL